jgi:hypothetical protein
MASLADFSEKLKFGIPLSLLYSRFNSSFSARFSFYLFKYLTSVNATESSIEIT